MYKVSEEPACSNPAQKNIAKKKNINITAILCFSTLVNGFLLSSLYAFSDFFTIGANPRLPRYLGARRLNATCPISIPIAEAKNPY